MRAPDNNTVRGQSDRSPGFRFPAVAGAAVLGLSGAIAACGSGSAPSPTTPGPSAPVAAEPTAAVAAGPMVALNTEPHFERHGRQALTLWGAPGAGGCPAVVPGQIYRGVAGVDTCPTAMSQGEIAQDLNDPWGQRVLVPNSGLKPGWPTDFDTIVGAATTALPGFQRHSYMLGEGSKIGVAEWPTTKDRDLRFIITWADDPKAPSVLFSARPPRNPPVLETLEVVAFDRTKRKFNFYHFVDVTGAGDTKAAKTWVWAGDSSHARNPLAIGQGCFGCHLNGGLNMKELRFPWNNWNAPENRISHDVVPPELASNPLFETLSGADVFEQIVETANRSLATDWVTSSFMLRGKRTVVNNVAELLRRLIMTTTVNLASTNILSAGPSAITGIPSDFFLFHPVLSDKRIGLTFDDNLHFSISRDDYTSFLKTNNVHMSNENGADPMPGSTYFAFFVPTPADEDVSAIESLIDNHLISPKFAAAVLMVDFQNPVFSIGRASLMTYAEQIPLEVATGAITMTAIPSRFAALVDAVAKTQPTCAPTALSRCTAEQQFMYFWSQPDASWKSVYQHRITEYLRAVQNRLTATQGAHDLLKLMISRGVQFSNYPLVCNLNEFALLLPQTDLGSIFVQMSPDGSLSPQPSYTCPSS